MLLAYMTFTSIDGTQQLASKKSVFKESALSAVLAVCHAMSRVARLIEITGPITDNQATLPHTAPSSAALPAFKAAGVMESTTR
jgi:hypothetical protein